MSTIFFVSVNDNILSQILFYLGFSWEKKLSCPPACKFLKEIILETFISLIFFVGGHQGMIFTLLVLVLWGKIIFKNIVNVASTDILFVLVFCEKSYLLSKEKA